MGVDERERLTLLPSRPIVPQGTIVLPALSYPFHLSAEMEHALETQRQALPSDVRGRAYLALEASQPIGEPMTGKIAAGIATHATDHLDLTAGAEYDLRRGARVAGMLVWRW